MAPKPVSVTQLNSYIKRVLQTDPLLGQVSVIGEVSNLKYHDSGHIYLSLKDTGGKINCFIPSSYAAYLEFSLEDGMEIVATGNVSVFERGGYYSLHIREIRLSGAGGLNQAFEQLKQKLLDEGLFDVGRKRPLPRYPRKVALITSPTGAVVQDMLKIIRTRNTMTDILIVPVLVQGPDAPADIVRGLEAVNREHTDTDLIIVGRGGGSLEELAPFNSERVVRAIAESHIPVISAVGHETDVTLSDFAADLRAETPTAAAMSAVPDTNEIQEYLGFLANQMSAMMNQTLASRELRVQKSSLESIRLGLQERLRFMEFRALQSKNTVERGVTELLSMHHAKISGYLQALGHLNPLSVLQRGYAAIADETGRLISGINELQPGDPVGIRFFDGTADAIIHRIRRNQYD